MTKRELANAAYEEYKQILRHEQHKAKVNAMREALREGRFEDYDRMKREERKNGNYGFGSSIVTNSGRHYICVGSGF